MEKLTYEDIKKQNEDIYQKLLTKHNERLNKEDIKKKTERFIIEIFNATGFIFALGLSTIGLYSLNILSDNGELVNILSSVIFSYLLLQMIFVKEM